MPRRTGHREGGKCKTCQHVERTRLDYLVCAGSPLKPLAARFGLHYSSLYNHSKKHISDEYRAAVRLGPFESEERLRQLCAENGTSVLENLRAIHAGVSARWLACFEAQADDQFGTLTGHLRKNLELMARLTKELVPVPSTSITNNISIFEHPEYVQAIAGLAEALRPYPEARKAVTAVLRSLGRANEPSLIELRPIEAA